jgi:hypothetical protein
MRSGKLVIAEGGPTEVINQSLVGACSKRGS